MKQYIMFTIIMLGFLWTNEGVAQNRSTFSENGPEFCTAIFITTNDLVEAESWVIDYALDTRLVDAFVAALGRALADGTIGHGALERAAEECRLARWTEQP